MSVKALNSLYYKPKLETITGGSTCTRISSKLLQEQYKEHISEYSSWDQQAHASDWMLFSKNVSTRLSINETALWELYTIVTNKEVKGRKGGIVAMIIFLATDTFF